MSKLVLKRFRCIEESDEIGDDSPYFLLFHGKVHLGNTHANSGVKLVRKSAWDNTVAEGDLINANMTVLNPLAADLVLAAMMEEDHDTDFTGMQLQRLRDWICPFFDSLGNSVSGMDGTVASLIRQEFRRGINALDSNDNLIQVRTVVGPGISGQPPLLRFAGGGARYDVRFTIE